MTDASVLRFSLSGARPGRCESEQREHEGIVRSGIRKRWQVVLKRWNSSDEAHLPEAVPVAHPAARHHAVLRDAMAS